jgi:outer membrane protein TolC
LRDKELDVRSGVKSAYAALFYDEKAIAILEDNAGLLRRFARAAESKYASGKASQVDVLKSQVELSKTLNSLVTARQRRDSDEALLNSLLNRPASSPLSTTGELTSPAPPMDQASLEKDALSERPEVRSAELAVEESRYGVRLARADYWPEFMLLYRWRDMDGGPDSRDAMAGVSVPIWFWRQNAGMRQARAEYEAARAGSQSARNKTAYEVRNLLTRAQASYQLIELYRTSVLPQAEQSLEVTRGAYASDKSDFLDLLDAVRTLRDLRLEHYEHIADYAKDRAELERVIGKELP